MIITWKCEFCFQYISESQEYLLAGIPGLPEWIQPRAALRALKVTHIMNKHSDNRRARELIIQIGNEANEDFKKALGALMKSP